MKEADIIDLSKHRKLKAKKIADVIKEDKNAPILDMTERRQEIIQNERREVKRTILTGFIGAFVVIPGQGLLKVDIYDISENGIAFDMDIMNGKFHLGEEVAMRVYMNQTTYFPFVIQIQNSRDIEDDNIVRHGSKFTEDSLNSQALYHFVKFIETVSASLEKDTGDVMVSNIKK